MTPEELAAIHERRGIRLPDAPTASEDIAALLAEVERLTEVIERRGISYYTAEAKGVAEARLDKVRVLHSPVAPSPSRPWVTCSGCTNGGTYPCPTIRAIDGSDQ